MILVLRVMVVVAVTTLAGCTSTRDERVGAFIVRAHKAEFAAHSATQLSLWYGFRRVTASLSDLTVDPRHPDRALFASRGECGTFLFDGRTGTRRQVSSRVMSVHPASKDAPIEFAAADPWSPDGHYVYAGNEIARPVVIDLKTGHLIELSDAVSVDGHRVEMVARVWSADGRRLAVELAPDGYNGGRDLIAITPETLDVEYVASMRGSPPSWTTRDYRWEGNRLVTVGESQNARIVLMPDEDRRWHPSPPRPTRTMSDQECH